MTARRLPTRAAAASGSTRIERGPAGNRARWALWLGLALLGLGPQSASACTGIWIVDGFEPEAAGATEVPTDAQLWIATNDWFELVVELTPVAGGPTVGGSFEELLVVEDSYESYLPFVPDGPLAANTEYEAVLRSAGDDYGYDPDQVIDSVRFTTGAGPAPAPVAPVVDDGSSTGWKDDSNAWYCVIGNPVEYRDVTLSVSLGEAGPLDHVLVRVAPGERGEGEVLATYPHPGPGVSDLEFPLPRHVDDERVGPECYVVAARGAAGVEVEDEPFCLPYLDEGAVGSTAGCGCSQSPGPTPGWFALVLLAGLRRRRRVDHW